MILDQNGNTSIITQEKATVIELVKKLQALYPKFKNNNIIVVLTTLNKLKLQDIVEFLEISNMHRASKQSFIIVSDNVNLDDLPDEIIVVPTIQEAYDIIEMEEMERDLGFNMNELYLAQVNIAKRLAPMDDPIMKDFVNNLDRINALADKSKGFVWRLKDEDKDLGATVFQDDTLLINMSVWENPKALFDYTYNTAHIEIFKRKKEWFSKMKMKHMAFWYVPKGYEPTFQDAKGRLDYLSKYGETPYAFTFKSKFTVSDSLNYKPLL